MQFVREHQGRLFGFAVNLCGDRVLAEDLVADVWAKACEKWARISAVDYPLAYVRRMVLNEFLKDRQRRVRTTASGELPEQKLVSPDPAVRHADLADLTAQLATLPRQQRAALVLRYFLDLPDADIAEELGCSVVTVRSHMFRGLAALRISQDDDRPAGADDPSPTQPPNPLSGTRSTGDQPVQFRLLPNSTS